MVLIMRLIYQLLFILALSGSQALAAGTQKTASDGVFTSVSGKVQVKKKGKKFQTVKSGTTVKAGEKISTGNNSNAVLRFFDGSELKVSPKTQFTIAKLEKNGLQDKALKFKLAVGDLWASVKKLTSSKSSFEIESGGVVCGVRGTQFSYHYDQDRNIVTVHVDEGTVYLNSDGHTYLFTAGQTGNFYNGNPGKSNPGQSNGNLGGNNGNGGNGNGNNEGNSCLADLNQQFGNSLAVNGDNTFTDPQVEGSGKVNVSAQLAAGETVP